MTKPTITDVRSAIDRSGYVLELRLVPKIEGAGFFVWSDRQFQDQDTGKSREIDLYAHKEVDIATREVTVGAVTYMVPDTFATHLVIECKTLSTPIVFFSRENKLPIFGRLLMGGFPRLIWEWNHDAQDVVGGLYESAINFGDFHSYWTPTHLATRFGRMISKKAGGAALEWDLEHGGVYPAIEKLCKATMSIHKHELARARRHEPEHTDQVHLHMTYPVLVVSGELFECRVGPKDYKVKPVQQLFLDWSLTSERVRGSFRICVVTERAFASFMRKVQIDHAGVESGVRRQLKKLREAAALEKQRPGLAEDLPDDA